MSDLGLDEDVDRVFDDVYPDWVQSRSERHWTPVAVARRAAELLVVSPATRVLDVGSGAGKFCIAGALATGGQFVGIEQEARLVEAARDAALRYGVARRARFHHGDLSSIDWRAFDSFYFYNPFAEQLVALDLPIDASFPLSPTNRDRYLDAVRLRLAAAPIGTRVATYHGCGGALPSDFRRAHREGAGIDVLELWIKEPTRVWRPPFEDEPTRELAPSSRGARSDRARPTSQR